MKNLAGKRFGRLIAIRPLRKRSTNGAVLWWCRCDCKKRVMVPSNSLLSGHSKSCGCWHRDAARKQIDVNRPKVSATLKHGGMSKFSDPALARAYRIYRGVLARCYNKNSISYPFYGAAGVTVTDSWLGPNGFVNFLHDMGKPPEGTQLGRLFDVGRYCKENCAWMSSQQQQEERRKKRHFIKNSLDQALLIGSYGKSKRHVKKSQS